MHSHVHPHPPGPAQPLPRRSVRALLQRRLSSMRTTKPHASPPIPTTDPHSNSKNNHAPQNSPLNIHVDPQSTDRQINSTLPPLPQHYPSTPPTTSPRRRSSLVDSFSSPSPSSPTTTTHKRSNPFRLRRQTFSHLHSQSNSATHSPSSTFHVPSSQPTPSSSTTQSVPALTIVPHQSVQQHSLHPLNYSSTQNHTTDAPSPERPASPALASTSFDDPDHITQPLQHSPRFSAVQTQSNPINHLNFDPQHPPHINFGKVNHLSAIFQRQNRHPSPHTQDENTTRRCSTSSPPHHPQAHPHFTHSPPKTVVDLVARFETATASHPISSNSPPQSPSATLTSPSHSNIHHPSESNLFQAFEPTTLDSPDPSNTHSPPGPHQSDHTPSTLPSQSTTSPPSSPKLSPIKSFYTQPIIEHTSSPLDFPSKHHSLFHLSADAVPTGDAHPASEPDFSHTPSATTLDFSSTEPYSSLNLRADRVANALERIGKRVADFTASGVDDDSEDAGLVPRDALIPLMIEGMQQHRTDRKVADRALNTLRRLTVSDACRARIGECGGIEAIVGIMRCHSLLVRIQTQACLALANLAYENKQNKEEIVRCGGLQVIVAALSHHESVEHVQSWGCLAIRNITNYTGPNQHELVLATEAIGVILCALDHFPKSAMVQQNGLIALVNIGGASPSAMDKIREQGGIQILVSCLQNNIRSDKMSEIGLCLARLLVENEKNQRNFGHSKGMEAITAIMDEHRRSLSITVKGCAAFRHLSFHRENRDLLGKCGGIRIIVSSMEEHFGADSDSMSYFLKSLSNATFDSLTNKTLAGRLGAIECTLRVLRGDKYRDDENVVADACRALRNLSDGVTPNHRMIMKSKGVPLVLDAVRLHGLHSEQVAEHSIAVFVNMVSYRGFINLVNEGNGEILKAAKDMMDAHVRNENIAKQSQSLLAMIGPSGPGAMGRPHRQGSMIRDLRMQTSMDRTLRSARSHHRYSSGEERQTRLQRLRSLPLPLSRYRGEMMASRQAA